MDRTGKLLMWGDRLRRRVTVWCDLPLLALGVTLVVVLAAWNVSAELFFHKPKAVLVAAPVADDQRNVEVPNAAKLYQLAEAMRVSRDFYLDLGPNEVTSETERLRRAVDAERIRRELLESIGSGPDN